MDTSNLVLKSDLSKVKAEVNKIDLGKLKTVPVDLSKRGDVVNNEVVKKTHYDKLAAKVINIDSCGVVLKAKYHTDKSSLEKKVSDTGKKIPYISGVVKKADYNAKITEMESKIPSISGLATTAALTAVEYKIADVNIINILVKKKTIMTQKH